MGYTFCFPWEIPFMQFVQSVENPIMTALATFFTMFGQEYFVIFLTGFCYWSLDKKLGQKVLAALCGSMVFGALIKGTLLRRRPYMDFSEVKCIRAASPDADTMSPVEQGYSFPSINSSLSAGVFGTIGINVKKTWSTVLAFIIPFFVGLSRIYLGVHYPTDVLAGWAVGTIALFLVYFIGRKFGVKVCMLIELAIGAAGFFYCRENEFFSIYGILLGCFSGFLYEEKFVQFENSKKWWSYLLRPVLGVLLFVGISALLKLPVQNISSTDALSFLFGYRCFRYALCTFIIMGPYTHLFKAVKLFFKRTN